jgi:hypothetical protein
VPRNNLGVIVGERENFVGGGNHAADCSARTGVDVGIHPVEKQVGHLNHIAPGGCRGKALRRLQTQVVNDKGRHHQQSQALSSQGVEFQYRLGSFTQSSEITECFGGGCGWEKFG